MASLADRIWNRATLGTDRNESAGRHVGDLALRSLLYAHGLVMNGGVFQCAHGVLSESELEAAIEGYSYFGLEDAAATLREAASVDDPWAERQEQASLDADARYMSAIPSDAVISERFESRLAAHPEDFAPIDP